MYLIITTKHVVFSCYLLLHLCFNLVSSDTMKFLSVSSLFWFVWGQLGMYDLTLSCAPGIFFMACPIPTSRAVFLLDVDVG